MKDRKWLRRLCYLHRVLPTKLPTYLYELISPVLNSHCNPNCYRALYCRPDLFWNSFLPSSINEWNKLDPDIKTPDSPAMFHKKLLTFISPSEKSVCNIYDPQGSKILNRLKSSFSHLHEHKFWHNFADTVNSLCSWALETESTDHFLLCRQNYISFYTALMNELSSIHCEIVSLKPTAFLEVIQYGDKKLND